MRGVRARGGANPLGVAGLHLDTLQSLEGPIDGLPQAHRFDWLQQIVDGVHLEGANRILVVRGDERDERKLVTTDEPHDAKAVDFRHLQIEQREIGREPLDELDAFGSVDGLPDDFHIVVAVQQRNEKSPRGAFVVGDDDAKPAHVAPSAARRRVAGRLSSTSVPPSVLLVMRSLPAEP